MPRKVQNAPELEQLMDPQGLEPAEVGTVDEGKGMESENSEVTTSQYTPSPEAINKIFSLPENAKKAFKELLGISLEEYVQECVANNLRGNIEILPTGFFTKYPVECKIEQPAYMEAALKLEQNHAGYEIEYPKDGKGNYIIAKMPMLIQYNKKDEAWKCEPIMKRMYVDPETKEEKVYLTQMPIDGPYKKIYYAFGQELTDTDRRNLEMTNSVCRSFVGNAKEDENPCFLVSRHRLQPNVLYKTDASYIIKKLREANGEVDVYDKSMRQNVKVRLDERERQEIVKGRYIKVKPVGIDKEYTLQWNCQENRVIDITDILTRRLKEQNNKKDTQQKSTGIKH